MSKITYKITVKPPKKMRYVTVGDYYKTKNGWAIEAVDLKNPDYNFLTHIHELVELYLTQRRGIAEPKIKKFDEWFQREKSKGHFKKISGPGSHPKAPYYREHILALKIEKILAKELKVNQVRQGKAEDKMLDEIEKVLKRNK